MPSRLALLLLGNDCKVNGVKLNRQFHGGNLKVAKKQTFHNKVLKGSAIGRTAAKKKLRRNFCKIKKNLKDEDVRMLVGPSSESWLQHLQRHPDTNKWAASCARCAFEVWARKKQVPKWMSWKPFTEGGVGGLGCCVCAASRNAPIIHQRRQLLLAEYKKNGICKEALCRRSSWSVYGVRRLFNARQFASAISMHEIEPAP